MNNIPGFASAQRQWENMEPKDSSCDCPQLYMCERCEDYFLEPFEGGQCPDEACRKESAEDGEPSVCKAIDREDIEFEAVSSCPQHGFCTGCRSPHCEDCGGEGANND